jgi:hypothetical protein
VPYHYRITVDTLDPLKPGEGGTESVSFFATTSSDILDAAKSLRERAGYSACHATKLALGLSLIGEHEALASPTTSSTASA